MESNNFFPTNLKELRKKYDDTQPDLADYLGNRSFSTISDWERGKSMPDAGTLNKIANRYNVTIDDLIEHDLRIEKTKFEKSDTKLIPIVGKVSAGTPNYAMEDIMGYMTIPPDKKVNNHMIYLEVNSDSMDKQFPVGSYVLVDTNAQIENGNIAVVKVNGNEATLKQIKFDNNQMYLIPNSTNESHFPQVVDIEEEEVILVGKVIGMYMSM